MVILLLLVALVPTASGQAGVIPIPPNTLAPTDPDGDGKYEDLNANGRKDFADVVLYFNQMTWIASNEPLAAFDFNGNNRIDFADVVALFNDLGATPTPTPTPTVTGIAPVSAYAGRTISATVSGTGFANGIEVALVGGGTTVLATNETLVSTNEVACTLAIPPDAYIGSYGVTVRNPGASSWVTKTGAFTVLAPPDVTVTGIAPATAYRGTTTYVTIYGTGFVPGAQVRITGGGQTIDATEESVPGPTTILSTLTIPSNAYVGSWDVGVRNPGETAWVTKAGALTVRDPPIPTITGFSPTTIYRGSITSRPVAVYGTNFIDGVEVVLAGGGQTVEAFGESVQDSSTINCNVFIPTNAYLGSWDVRVRNPGTATWVTKTNAFVIRDVPTVSSISPSSAARGQTVTVTVSGSSFGEGLSAYLFTPGTMVWGTDVTLLSANQFRCSFAIPSDAAVGGYTLAIMIPGMSYTVESSEGFFTVRA
ncbi:MAG TPA: hypothetical protein PLY91_04680 [Methanoregulaceae archaeon]|nr:hypothetical protein [Methanoregulaceae archaeon]